MKPQIDEIENEAKANLSEEKFNELKNYFKIGPTSVVQQINKYFDTANKDIRKKLPLGTTLRVRNKKGNDVLEFKVRKENKGTEEYKDILTNETYENLFENYELPDGNVKAKLTELGITGPFYYLGDLDTLRSEAADHEWPDAQILLDESTFPGGSTDFELEVESHDYNYSHQVRDEICKKFDIKQTPVLNKIDRFYKVMDSLVG